MNKSFVSVTVIAACLSFASPSQAAELVTNGNFAAGLTGWSIFTTANGTVGTPVATTFDVTGDGIAETTSRLQVGQLASNTVAAGGGLSQGFTLGSAGTVNFSADIAAFFPATLGTNSDAGTLSVLIDGTQYDLTTFGGIGSQQTLRDTLSFSTTLAAGQHTLSLLAARRFLNSGTSPYQYFTNVSLQDNVAAVPELGTWLMMLVGFGMVGSALRWRVRSTKVRFA